jgi:hypothetical protein
LLRCFVLRSFSQPSCVFCNIVVASSLPSSINLCCGKQIQMRYYLCYCSLDCTAIPTSTADCAGKDRGRPIVMPLSRLFWSLVGAHLLTRDQMVATGSRAAVPRAARRRSLCTSSGRRTVHTLLARGAIFFRSMRGSRLAMYDALRRTNAKSRSSRGFSGGGHSFMRKKTKRLRSLFFTRHRLSKQIWRELPVAK